MGKISDTLDRMGIDSPTGKKVWSREAILKLLANGKYTGDVILGKTHVVDRIQVKSHDVDKQVFIEDHYPVIISHELFHAVRQKKHRRSRSRVVRQNVRGLDCAHSQEDSSSKQRIGYFSACLIMVRVFRRLHKHYKNRAFPRQEEKRHGAARL